MKTRRRFVLCVNFFFLPNGSWKLKKFVNLLNEKIYLCEENSQKSNVRSSNCQHSFFIRPCLLATRTPLMNRMYNSNWLASFLSPFRSGGRRAQTSVEKTDRGRDATPDGDCRGRQRASMIPQIWRSNILFGSRVVRQACCFIPKWRIRVELYITALCSTRSKILDINMLKL